MMVKVSRSGEIPGPTVKVRMGEGNDICQALCLFCVIATSIHGVTPKLALILVTQYI